MRICVIGNSHCGALVSAWRADSEGRSDKTLTFFAMRGRAIKDLRVSWRRLVAKDRDSAKALAFTSGGIKRIDPRRYDRVLVYGLIRQPPATDTDDGFSLALREAVLTDWFDRSLAKTMVMRLRQITDKPIDVAPAPFQLAPKGAVPGRWALAYEDEARSFARSFDTLGARFWPQPPETIVPGGTRATRPEFSKGSVRLAIDETSVGKKHAVSDLKHANRAFGTIWLQTYLDGLG